MPERYTDRIKAYCESQGIAIPSGFFRHPASRYAAIDVSTDPPRLVAKTWFTLEDVLYYLEHLAGERKLKVMDFQSGQLLEYRERRWHRREIAVT